MGCFPMPSTRNSSGAKTRIYLSGLILWLVAVTLASLLPVDELGASGWEIPYQDKIAHFVFYFGAMWLAGKAVQTSMEPGPERRTRFLRVTVALILFGILIEGLQMILPTGRSAQWTDVLANIFGIVVALASLKRGFHEVVLGNRKD